MSSKVQPSHPSARELRFPAQVPQAVAAVAGRIGRSVQYDAGARLFAAGQRVLGIHVVLEGAVRILREGEGRAIVVHREGPGGLLGEVAFFGDGTYPGTAVAAEPTRALLLPAEALHRELRTNGELSAVFLRRLAARSQEIIRRLDRVAHLTVLRRLARHLVERREQASRTATAVSLGMTLVELAEELGTVKEVLVRELRVLRRLRLVEPAGRGLYRIVDLAALRELAGAP